MDSKEKSAASVGIGSAARARQLGAYYTPHNIASAIASWAIRNGDESILEPSAGAGALLLAAYEQAHNRSSNPKWHATAFDIDSGAINRLRKLDFQGLQVYRADFLSVRPEFHQNFDVVLANPPFTRNHELPSDTRRLLRERFGTKGAVGLWAHFLFHSLSFLKEGGRLASIVPRSAFFTVHGNQLLEQLTSKFNSIGIYELKGKPDWSQIAEESGAVILAEGYKCGVASSYKRGTLNPDGTTVEFSRFKSETFKKIEENSIRLGEIAQLSIGVVTGRNSVFLLNENERISAKINQADLRSVVSRQRQLGGISLSKTELELMAHEGQKTWLLLPKELNSTIQDYLSIISDEDREKVVWFKKRKPWWKVQLADRYDAVFTYMNDLGPRLVKLEYDIICTNTMHRVAFKDDISNDQRISAFLSPISTFGQLAAEKIGRAYSGGLLKFELAEARRLPIVTGMNLSEELLRKVDSLMKKNYNNEARNLVDETLMPAYFGASWHDALEELTRELEVMRSIRRKNNKES